MGVERITYGPWTGGINRAKAKEDLGQNELYEACGVYQYERGALNGCFEENTRSITFATAATSPYNARIPLRILYWPDRGKIWQLSSTDSASNTSIREEDLNYSFGTFSATGVVYTAPNTDGLLVLCGAGQQARVYDPDFVATDKPLYLGSTYDESASTTKYANVTNGTTSITGVGSSWSTFMAPGMKITFYDVTTSSYYPQRALQQMRSYTIASVTNDTAAVLSEAYAGSTASPIGYRLATSSLQVNLPFIWKERLGFVGSEPATYTTGTISTSGSTVTGQGTSFVGNVARGDIFYVNGVGRSITAVISNTSLTLDSSAGTVASTSYAVVTGEGDYNVLYFAGYPGDTTTNREGDIYDFMYVDALSGTPIGLGEGAIQRVIPLEDRLIVFLQNAVYRVTGDPSVNFDLGSNFAITRIANTGLNAYDAATVGPDGQTIYFASPDGLFKIENDTVTQIDIKIRDHEFFTRNINYAACFQQAIYFTDGTDDPDRIQNENSGAATLRRQYACIWIYDVPSLSWTYTQRLKGNGSSDYRYTPDPSLYMLGMHGGVYAPYRGDLTESERLYVSSYDGLVAMNDQATAEADKFYHAATVITPHTDFQDASYKRTKNARLVTGLYPTAVTPIVIIPGEGRYGNSTGSSLAKVLTATETTQEYRAYKTYGEGGKGSRHVSIAIGDLSGYRSAWCYDLTPATSGTLSGSPAHFEAVEITPEEEIRPSRVEFLLQASAVGGGGLLGLEAGIFTSNGTTVSQVAAGTCSTAWRPELGGDYYWVPFAFATIPTLTSGSAYYVGIKNSSGTVYLRTATRDNDNQRYVTAASCESFSGSGGVTEQGIGDVLQFRLWTSVGGNTCFDELTTLEAEYLPLPGRKR